ncbi:hypothetical protein B0H13DRAFT_2382357 [Mycena leptocephala]|nr:hypothetical protein B0H13DRAFT_2382357 [Mycena leptocephala]
MVDLPQELQDIIFSFLDDEDLWELVQVSRPLRQRVLFPLLLRYNIAAFQIYSGEVCVPGNAYFRIPMIYHIHPIQKLSVVPGRLKLHGLPSVLTAIPLIPDVEIRGTVEPKRDSAIAGLIQTLSRGAVVAIAGHGSVWVPKPRKAAPLSESGFWIPHLPLPKLNPLVCGGADLLWGFVFFLPVCILFLILDLRLLLLWLYRRVFGPRWDYVAPYFVGLTGDSMRIKRVSAHGVPQFALVTFCSTSGIYLDFVCPTLSPAQSSAIFSVLDLKDDLFYLSVRANAALGLSSLLTFIRRHQSLNNLTLAPGAIDPASLPVEPTLDAHRGRIASVPTPAAYIPVHLPPHPSLLPPSPVPGSYPGRITSLTSPAEYIPYILSTERSITDLIIDPASYSPHLARALTAIALSGPDATLRRLTLALTPPGPAAAGGVQPKTALPWRAPRDVEAELPLRGVTHLTLRVEFEYSAVADVEGLVRWLARFPELQVLELRGGSVAGMERVVLARAIGDARAAMGAGRWEGVYYFDA